MSATAGPLVNGCHNRAPFKRFYFSTGGHVPIPHVNTTDCRYTLSSLGQSDARCAGCKWRAVPVAASPCGCMACEKQKVIDGRPWLQDRMILCPQCGDKRCPHAGDHRHACTGRKLDRPGAALVGFQEKTGIEQ